MTKKIALITGGGTGIGAASAMMIAPQAEHIIVASNTPTADMQSTCDAVIARGCGASAETVNVADDAAVKAMIDRTVAKHGRIDWLVNCAGIFDVTPVFETEGQRIQRLMDVNFMGTFNVIHHVLPHMRAHGKGEIVSISSGAGVLGQGNCAGYAASKSAVKHFTATLAPELAGTGIRANSIAPGAIRTQMTALVHTPQSDQMRAALKQMETAIPSPYNAAFLEPEDIASIVLFLLSDAARGIQGACIVADQGLSAAMPKI